MKRQQLCENVGITEIECQNYDFFNMINSGEL